MDTSKGYPHSYLEKYWDAMYLELRCPSMINVNPHYVMADSPAQTQLSRAAGFASGIARWWTKVTSGSLEPDAAGKNLLCMSQVGAKLHVTAPQLHVANYSATLLFCTSQYDRVLGCARYPMPGCDELETFTGSRHIAVVCPSGHKLSHSVNFSRLL